MRQIRCQTCKKAFSPERGTRRKNCYTCRPFKRGAGGSPAPVRVDTEPVSRGTGPIELVTVAELSAAGRLDTVSGQIAVRLAHQMDDEHLTGSQVSSLGAQLERTMEKATAGAPPPADEVDDFTARIMRKRDTA